MSNKYPPITKKLLKEIDIQSFFATIKADNERIRDDIGDVLRAAHYQTKYIGKKKIKLYNY
jgi:hypothetical protein